MDAHQRVLETRRRAYAECGVGWQNGGKAGALVGIPEGPRTSAQMEALREMIEAERAFTVNYYGWTG